MASWIYNIMKIEGEPSDVTVFLKAIKGPKRRPGRCV